MQTLYLLGGNGSTRHWWEDTLPLFRRYHTEPLELPGFGDNPLPPCTDLDQLAQAVLAATQPGAAILACGVNALPVLRALVLRPNHFGRVILLAPIGAYLWQRKLPRLMQWKLLRHAVHFLLANRPAWFRNKFSSRRWRDDQYARMGDGYRRCRAFAPYWDMVQPDVALTLAEWISTPIELVWGGQDRVVNWAQASAWSAILARAQLTVTLQADWGHYPWIDDPGAFVQWLEYSPSGFPAHTKAGRLRLAELAGLAVPAHIRLTDTQDNALDKLLGTNPHASWAVRSSGANEDQADQANAGLSHTFLRVVPNDVPTRVRTLLSETDSVVVQRFIEPRCSGIAFARHLSVEVEWVEGHLAQLADGQGQPQRATLSRMPSDWIEGGFPTLHGLTQQALWHFLQSVVHAFHYMHCDIEWAWDGVAIQLLQVRPVTVYAWRRNLTAANIGEILPSRPSRLMEYAQRRAATSIPAIWARWDRRVLADNEPFTATYDDASYINQDLFLARLADWGFSSTRYAEEIGGAAPALPRRPSRWIKNLPVFWRMLRHSRQALALLSHDLQRFDAELTQLVTAHADSQLLADWFTRFYVKLVQGNLCIGAAIATSGGDVFGRPATVYRSLESRTSPHRLPFETDPATLRPAGAALPLLEFPAWPHTIKALHRLGMPGLRAYYHEVREWYRDNLMRIFFRLHHAFPAAEREHWFAPHTALRDRQGAFWQDGGDALLQSFSFVIYPGGAEGTLGEEILLVDSLDPGRYESYQQANAVIAKNGGRLSHGATLLRELNKPSAVIPRISESWRGQQVRYANGTLSLLTEQGK